MFPMFDYICLSSDFHKSPILCHQTTRLGIFQIFSSIRIRQLDVQHPAETDKRMMCQILSSNFVYKDFFGALPFIIKDNYFQFLQVQYGPNFSCCLWSCCCCCGLLSILRCSAAFLLLLLCSRCTAAANAAAAAVGDSQLLPSPAAGC